MDELTMTRSLLGTWSLVELVRLIDGAVASHPLGPDCVGQLTYQPDGRMSALLMERDRTGPEGFIAYGGPFRVQEDRVVHRAEISLLPEWLGTDLVRTVSWVDEQLVLSSLPVRTRSGRLMHDRLTWRRVQPGGVLS